MQFVRPPVKKLVGVDPNPLMGLRQGASQRLSMSQARIKVHPKGRKGDILILPFQPARRSDFAEPDLAAEQRSSDPAVKSALYGLGLFAHRGGK